MGFNSGFKGLKILKPSKKSTSELMDRILHVIMTRLSAPLGKHHEEYTVGYARTNVIGSRTSFVIATVRSNIH